MDLDMRLVLQFVTVAEELSFTRAAARLSVAQPWLSARIRKLEAQIGFPLFDRSTRHVELTDYGRVLYDLARPVAMAAENLRVGAAALRREASGRLRIGDPPSGGPDPRKSALFEQFTRSNSNVTVELEPGVSHALLDRLGRGLLDAAFVIDPPDDPAFETLRLHRLTVSAVLRPDDPLAGHASIRCAQLEGRPVAVFPRGINPRFFDHVYGGLAAAGVRFLEVPELRRSLLFRKSSPDGLLLASILPDPGEGASRGDVVRRPIIEAPAIWLHLARRRVPSHGRAVERLWSVAIRLSEAQQG